MPDTILVLNAGSSSLKLAAFVVADDGTLAPRLRGVLAGIGGDARLTVEGAVTALPSAAGVDDHEAATALVLDWLERELRDALPTAVGHRVVHGGARFERPVRVDDAVLAELAALTPLAPLHQPQNLAPIRAIRAHHPELLQVACFDTSFHRGHPEVADLFALPRAFADAGVRRYGFHGLSYEYVAGRLPAVAPAIADGRVIVAHLGNGASLCALRHGRSLDSTMSFTALDGLIMGTRPGTLDPGVVLWLMQERGMDAAAIATLLYEQSGLLGLSGIASDMRVLLASTDPRAALAVDCFTYRLVREVGALVAVLGGLDGLVFTGGIGEHAAEIRARLCQAFGWLGLVLDTDANARHALRITTAASRPSAWVVPTDEERMIAEHTHAIMATTRTR